MTGRTRIKVAGLLGESVRDFRGVPRFGVAGHGALDDQIAALQIGDSRHQNFTFTAPSRLA